MERLIEAIAKQGTKVKVEFFDFKGDLNIVFLWTRFKSWRNTLIREGSKRLIHDGLRLQHQKWNHMWLCGGRNYRMLGKGKGMRRLGCDRKCWNLRGIILCHLIMSKGFLKSIKTWDRRTYPYQILLNNLWGYKLGLVCKRMMNMQNLGMLMPLDFNSKMR